MAASTHNVQVSDAESRSVYKLKAADKVFEVSIRDTDTASDVLAKCEQVFAGKDPLVTSSSILQTFSVLLVKHAKNMLSNGECSCCTQQILIDALALPQTALLAPKYVEMLGVSLVSFLAGRGDGDDLLDAEMLARKMLPMLESEGVSVAKRGVLGVLATVLIKRAKLTDARNHYYLALAVKTKGADDAGPFFNTAFLKHELEKLQVKLRVCDCCGASDVKMKVCSRCRTARYCGQACAKLHYKGHKTDCKRIAAEDATMKS